MRKAARALPRIWTVLWEVGDEDQFMSTTAALGSDSYSRRICRVLAREIRQAERVCSRDYRSPGRDGKPEFSQEPSEQKTGRGWVHSLLVWLLSGFGSRGPGDGGRLG